MDHNAPDLQVTAPLEILSILRTLHERKTLVHLHVPGRQLAIITTVLGIDEKSRTLIIDNASEDELNKRLLQATSLSLEAQLDGIRIVFSVQGVQPCQDDGKPAFKTPFPDSIVRLQRREFFRIDIPLSENAVCILKLLDPPYTLKLKIRDISAGGLGLHDYDFVLENALGTVFEHCTLQLPGQPPLTTSIKVVRLAPEKLENNKTVLRAGCAFTDMSNQARIHLQRYISQLERKEIARRRGLE